MIIGLGGKIGSGKTEVALYLVEKFKLPKIEFAKGLKDIVTSISGLTDEDKLNTVPYDGNINFGIINSTLKQYEYPQLNQKDLDTLSAIEYHNKGDAYRLLLQYVGTEIFRKRNVNHWVNVLVENASKFKHGFICDDVRFPNEHIAIKGRFRNDHNVTIKVVNTTKVSTDTHASELMMDRINFDVILKNNHDGIEKLHEQIDSIFSNIRSLT